MTPTTIKPRRAPSGVRLRDLPDVLHAKDIAQVLRCSRSTVFEMFRSGTLPAVAVTPRRYVVAKSAFVAWLEKRSKT